MADATRHDQLVSLAREAGQYGERGTAHLKRQAAGAELRAIEIGAVERQATALERIVLYLERGESVNQFDRQGLTAQLSKSGD